MKNTDIKLEPEQADAITHNKGHLRIVACPGSGKTETVSRRIIELIKSGVDPKTIVAFTFTQKAAENLNFRIRKRLQKVCPEKKNFGDMYIGTIDSFCLYMLKELIPEYRSYDILSEQKRMAFVNRWFYDLHIKSLWKQVGSKWMALRTFVQSADRILMEDINPDDLSNEEFVKSLKAYWELLEREKFFDFSSVIYKLISVLEDKKNLALLHEKVKHVTMDEYQDVNNLQEKLLQLLSVGADSVCVVGDDDQNIFNWRGSNVGYIRDFEERYKKYDVTTKFLKKNFRSTEGIIDTALQLINNNVDRISSKEMIHNSDSEKKTEEGDIVHRHFLTDGDELDFVAQKILRMVGTDFIDKVNERYALSLKDFAIIVKTNSDAEAFLNHLERNGIKCIADSGVNIFSRPIVSLALDCISYVFSCPGYTTEKTIPDINNLATRLGQCVSSSDINKFKKDMESIKMTIDTIASRKKIVLDEAKKKTKKISYDYLTNKFGLQEYYQRILNAMGAEDGFLSENDFYNLAVLSTAISDFEYVYPNLRVKNISELKWFLLAYAENTYNDPKHNDPTLVDGVRVLTIWKAKGLEFPVVFIPNFVEKNKPSSKQNFVDNHLYDFAKYEKTDEDDRRSYYTAITRSEKFLFITGSSSHYTHFLMNGKPATKRYRPHSFLDEIGNPHFTNRIDIENSNSGFKVKILDTGTFPTSFSELSFYGRCPYDYKIRHVFGFNPGVPKTFGYGTNIHNIINVIHSKYIRERRVPTEKEIVDLTDRMFHLRFGVGDMKENMKRTALTTVKNYVNFHSKNFSKILDSEKRFQFVMDKALISGTIDLIKDAAENQEILDETKIVETIDFKTDKEIDGKYKLDHSEQVRFYSLAESISLNSVPKKGTIHHIDTNKTEDVKINSNELQKTQDAIIRKIDGITSGNFDAEPEKDKCEGCDWKALCQHKKFLVGANFKK
uniref:DNA 3'-5' helicase n=1 Tax=uncultured marine thaumarchaeote KM3_47_F06 TaxID=1456168 RepID=A0A075H422_9ARCH|nr:superfamily I helicase (uvrD, pcrA) [uncultured marine thaumarchaeote KM3_47_F06]